MTAQRRSRRRRPGEIETIAERRAMALELRKQGSSYREIGRQLGIDVHTAHGDVGAELAALRETTVAEARELRALELERLDGMMSGLWMHIKAGSAPAVSAGVRVCERRARLLGLDAPTTSTTELSGSLSVVAETRLKAEAQELKWLDLRELEDLATKSSQLIEDPITRSRVRRSGASVAVLSLAAATVDADDVVTGEPTEQLKTRPGNDE